MESKFKTRIKNIGITNLHDYAQCLLQRFAIPSYAIVVVVVSCPLPLWFCLGQEWVELDDPPGQKWVGWDDPPYLKV